MKKFHRFRQTYILDLPVKEGTEVLNPSQVVVRLPGGRTLDVGALCYVSRAARRTGAKNNSTAVDSTTFQVRREKLVVKLIELLSDELRASVRPETSKSRFDAFRRFMHWADTMGMTDVADDPASARFGFARYVNHLKSRVTRSDQLSNNSGALQQNLVHSVLASLLHIDDFLHGLSVLRYNSAESTPTSPPSEDAQGQVLELSTLTFSGLATLVLEKKAYPYALSVPKYLECAGDILWVFPSIRWVKNAEGSDRCERSKLHCWGYNYTLGRVATLDELRCSGALSSDHVRLQTIRSSQAQIAAANENLYHPRRVAAGVVALKCFVMLFMAQTAMNWAQLVALEWDDDFTVTSGSQGFRTIKPRAGGKAVAFELPVEMMPFFLRYLELRRFLLQGQACDLLFFTLGGRAGGSPRKLPRSAEAIYLTLFLLAPSIPKVMPRQWRAAKSDWLIRYRDVSTTALVLQSSEKTVRKAYAAGSESVAIEEMGAFLNKVSQKVMKSGLPLPKGVERAIGKCVDFGAPVPEVNAALKPDCGSPEGCLFCSNYKLHADEKDTRKLLSCRYCLRNTASVVGSEEHLQKFVKPIIHRIDVLLAEISEFNEPMVKAIASEVDDQGELDPYWARKLEMLAELGFAS